MVKILLIGEKNGTKRYILVDERGVLLSIVVTGANRHDVTQIEVEVAHSWLNRFRKLLVRFEKTNASYEALLHLAASIIAFRKISVI